MWSYSSIILCSFEFKHIRSRFVKLKWLFWSRGKFHRFKWKWIIDNVTTKICHITAEMTLQWKYFTRFRVNHDAFYVNLNQYCFIIKDVFQVIHERKIHTKPSKWNVVRLCCTFFKSNHLLFRVSYNKRLIIRSFFAFVCHHKSRTWMSK